MIISIVNGGLGNQMNQYAAGKAIARSLNTDFYVNNTWFKSNHTRKYLLDKITDCKTDNITLLPKLRENSHFYDLSKVKDNSMLSGYYFSYKYHDNYTYKDFNIHSTIRTDLSGIIGIHVRRTDKAYSKIHYALSIEYYIKAMSLIESLTDVKCYYIFSDDLEWCKQIKSKKDIKIINGNAIFDLSLMSLCEHNIIANSSFSYWAAILNPNPNKIIIAPKAYYRDGNNFDIYPKFFTLI
jgi:hypothetical protein